MARISKDYDERKNDILDAAQKLFLTLGYEKTPISAILDALNISKGTFYHYFESKEELLDCLVERLSGAFIRQLEPVIDNPAMNALEKINWLFASSGNWKVANRAFITSYIRVMYCDENVLMRHKTTLRNIRVVAPLLSRIIEQGRQEGVFDTPSPEDAAEIIMGLGFARSELMSRLFLELDEHPEHIEVIRRQFTVYDDAIRRILGAPEGSIRTVDPAILEAFLRSN